MGARLVTLIFSDDATFGKGDSVDDPVRRVHYLYTLDGTCVATFDPCATDEFRFGTWTGEVESNC